MSIEPLRIRRLREQLSALDQYARNLYLPIEEGLRDAPVVVLDCFDGLLGTLDEFDRQLAKIDGCSGAVGGILVLREEWREPTREKE